MQGIEQEGAKMIEFIPEIFIDSGEPLAESRAGRITALWKKQKGTTAGA